MKSRILYLFVSFAYFTCLGQTYFDNTYKTGYNNVLSSNVLSTADSGCVFVNYIRDSLTHRQDFGLLRLDKNGNELVKKSFNMFNNDYSGFLQGMKQFIPATPCSYFLTGGISISNKNAVVLNKINRFTLDTIKTIIYSNPSVSYVMGSFIKFSDNKYFLVGSGGTSTTAWSVLFQMDSNLTINNIVNILTTNLFACVNAIYNPVNKKILMQGWTTQPQYPLTFVEIDTLGVITNSFSSVSSFTTGFSQIFFSPIDTCYIGIGGSKTAIYGNNNLYKLAIAKYDINLKMRWLKKYGDNSLTNGLGDAVILTDGSIVASGNYSKLTSLPLLNEDANGIILKVDKDGHFKWMKEYSHYGPGNFRESLYGIDKTFDNGFILCGSVMNLPKAKAWSIRTDSVGCVIGGCGTSSITVDSLIIKEPVDTSSTVDFKELILRDYGFSLFPNPAQDFLDIKFTSLNTNLYKLQITDLSGRKLESIELRSESNVKLSISEYSPGIYFVSLYKEGIAVETKKLIIVR